MTRFGDLTGRRILVTGSSSGIGRAVALELADAGADVILHGRKATGPIEDVAAEIAKRGGRVEIRPKNLLTADGAAELLSEEAWATWGGLDGAVLNAGVDLLTGESRSLPYEEKLDRLLKVDVRASVVMGRSIGDRMKEQGHGSILTIGWDQADRGMEGDSGELFAVAKNAVMGFTRSLAVSLAPKVRVNCIAPGWIRTAWGDGTSQAWHDRVLRETPLARWGTPEDIARLARFLLSDDASYLTGQVLNANGGAVR
ncbi:3-oxoacyl-[acyl-carrier-protein] reductase FabG [Caulifigura coniformis]|uniref:3-oxoacyl-[acyl-carrier-protein] reductase FabG n=1 Tax=Caulifigura coniformis TaxID=2527983 RepID=A0A517S9T2_9PLAN|nr:SDR family oxidoreductase [Caulifigura coniformis]QDT52888.1 3-oxoacyl-[acyl-carrier-protein] reductase FabG [Caulifigura coniformis]